MGTTSMIVSENKDAIPKATKQLGLVSMSYEKMKVIL